MVTNLRRLGVRVGMLAALLAIALSVSVSLAPHAHAQASHIECSSTVLKVQGVKDTSYWFGYVYVTMDKLVDSVDGAYCGEFRNHSQVRLAPNFTSGSIGGKSFYGPDVYHMSSYVYNPNVYVAPSGSNWETVDSYGQWIAAECGDVRAVFTLNDANHDGGSSGDYIACP